MQRLQHLNGHFDKQETFNQGSSAAISDDDVVICATARTAMTRAKRGPQANTAPEKMLSVALKGLMEKAKCDPKVIQSIAIGNVNQPGSGAATSRMGQFLANIPYTVPLESINRQCSSGLQSCAHIANAIRAGEIEVGIGGGVESMSLFSMQGAVDPNILCDEVYDHPEAQKCLMGMGITSDNVATKFGITREQQDQMAVESHAKAAYANKMGWLQSEITPYKTTVVDKEGNEKEVMVDKDDGVRPTTTLATLAKLKGAFNKTGTTTAGNASQVTDGAAAVLLAKRSAAKKLGLPILGRFLSFQVAGVPPEIMGIGPAAAIPLALEKSGLKIEDIDVWEINEAFASQATYCVQKLGVPKDKLNPRGGAIALGHPLGMTGARMICTLFSELERTNKKRGVVSMCIGTGMGAAGIFERE